jgi:IPT/TIG domain
VSTSPKSIEEANPVTNAVRFNQFSRIPVLACLTLGLVLLFFVPAPALGQAFVQVNSAAANSAAYTGAQTVGDLNVVVIGWGGVSSVTGVTDTAGNTYAPAGGTFSTSSGANTISQAIWYAANIKAAAAGNAVTVGFNNNESAPDIRILEYSGLSATFPLETASGGTGNGGTGSSGSVTNAANSVIVAGGTTSGAFGASPNFTKEVLTPDGNIAGETIAASGGSSSATDSVSGNWVLQAAVFGAAATSPAAPTITSLTPQNGPDTGGTGVAITGTNFSTGASVKFGSLSGVNCAVANSTTINCLTPAEGSGPVNVTVTNVDGQTATSLASGGGGFQFQLQTPTIATVAPTTGPTNGATSLTISGGNFLAGATVSVNSPVFETPGLPALPGGNVVVNNAGTITVNNPALPAGAADVTVRNPDGGSITATGIFTYAPVPGGINYVQRADAAVAHGGSQNPPAPMLTPETKGDLNVVIIGWADVAATVSGVSDSEGNTYVAALPTVNGNALSQAIYYAKNIVGDGVTPNTITVHFSRSATAPDVRVIEYNGLDTSNPLDAVAGASDTTASNLADTGSCTATAPGELVVAGATVANQVTGPDPGTTTIFAMTDSTTNGNGAEQAVLSAAGSCEAKMQLIVAEDWVIQAVTFKTVAANFTLTPTPATLSVGAGSNASYAIAVNAINGFTGPVTFTTCAGLPTGAGLSCSVSPASVNPGSSATLTITTSSTTPLATYSNITVAGTSGVLVQTATVSLKVTAAAPPPSFSMTATALTPASIAAGATSTSTVTVTPANGFNSAVSLTCQITPVTAVPPTCSFSSASVAGGSGTSTLTVTTKAAVASLRPNRERTTFYAMLLPLGGLTLLGAGLTSRRRKLLGLLLVFLMVSGLIFMLACGGGSSGGGGGGGGGGGTPATTAGTYTVTVVGTSGTMGQSVSPSPTVIVQ